MSQDILSVDGLKAYYQMSYFGIEREVRAVDDITMTVRKNEVYGIAGESSSGKTSFIKVLAAAIRPPFRVVDGSVRYDFGTGPIDITTASEAEIEAIRWRQPELHHAGVDERAQSGAADRQDLRGFRGAAAGADRQGVSRPGGGPSGQAEAAGRCVAGLSARAFGRHAAAGDHRARDRVPSRIHHRRRADDGARRGGAKGSAEPDPRYPEGHGQLGGVRDPRHERACQYGRPGGHHLCRAAGGGRADARDVLRAQASLYRPSGGEPAAHRRHDAAPGAGGAAAEPGRRRRAAAGFIRGVRWRSPSARPMCRRSRPWARTIARACWRWQDVEPLVAPHAANVGALA